MPIFASAARGIFRPPGSAVRPMRMLVPCDTFPEMAGMVRTLREHPFASDAALALLLAVLVLSDVLTSGSYLTGSKWVYVPVALLMTVPLAWRRRSPLVVLVVVMGAFAAQSLVLDPTPTPDSELIPALLAVYSVAAHGTRWVPYVGGGLSLVAGLIWL